MPGPSISGLVGWWKQDWWKHDWNIHLGQGLALLKRQYFRGQLETLGSSLAFHSFNLASLLVRQVCCSMKIDSLLLADFGTLLNKGGNKTHSEQWKGFTEALAQDITHPRVNHAIYVGIRASLVPNPWKSHSVRYFYVQRKLPQPCNQPPQPELLLFPLGLYPPVQTPKNQVTVGMLWSCSEFMAFDIHNPAFIKIV